MATHEIGIHPTKPLAEEPGTGPQPLAPRHPAVVRCEPGDEVVLDTRDALDGQITPDSTAADVAESRPRRSSTR